jgi:hypothetical protein
MDERQLLEKLTRIEALHAGAATPGERDAAAAARERIRARLQQMQTEDPPVEYSFKVADQWSYRLLVALLRRYEIRPYRYSRQRRTTLMARVPRRFVDEVLWPEFTELSRILRQYLSDVTERVIATALEPDASEVEERSDPESLPESTSEPV